MRIKDVEPMINNSPTSIGYGKPFGVILTYADGRRKRFSDVGLVLCASLTKKQRAYVKKLQAEIEKASKEEMAILATFSERSEAATRNAAT